MKNINIYLKEGFFKNTGSDLGDVEGATKWFKKLSSYANEHQLEWSRMSQHYKNAVFCMCPKGFGILVESPKHAPRYMDSIYFRTNNLGWKSAVILKKDKENHTYSEPIVPVNISSLANSFGWMSQPPYTMKLVYVDEDNKIYYDIV